MGLSFRLAYAATIPFSRATTLILCFLYVLGFCGLLVFNFLTQAKQTECVSSTKALFDNKTCEVGRLDFARTYYTRPVQNVTGQAGVFPWTPLGFGDGSATKGPIDYSILSSNWTAQALQCIMYEQVVTLHLDSGGWTIAACYYCGNSLRLLCTSLDSERTQLAGDPNSTRVDVGSACTSYRNQIQQVATTTFDGAIVLSARMITKRAVSTDIVDVGTLPYTSDSSTVILGTTIGSSVIYANNSNAATANLATQGLALATIAEQATAEDLQPPSQQRTLQASYSCRTCQKKYKPTIEIIAVVGAAIFAILTPAFAFARLIAELLAPNPNSDNAITPMPLASPGLKPSTSAPVYPATSYAPVVESLPYSPQPQPESRQSYYGQQSYGPHLQGYQDPGMAAYSTHGHQNV